MKIGRLFLAAILACSLGGVAIGADAAKKDADIKIKEGGCCDKAKNRHAARHFELTGHPVIRAYHERGMDWLWCRVDQTLLDPQP